VALAFAVAARPLAVDDLADCADFAERELEEEAEELRVLLIGET
jgi:hypothetical protein